MRRLPKDSPEETPLFRAEPESVPPVDRLHRPLRDLLVLTSGEELLRWSRRRIAQVLVEEAQVADSQAEEIAARVEEQILQANLRVVSTSVIRDLVGAELVTAGLEAHRARHSRLGVSVFDTGRILRGIDPDAGESGPEDPLTTALTLGRRVKRDYALSAVLSPEVAEAHRRGDYHIHDLASVDRPESVSLDLERLLRGTHGPPGTVPRAAKNAAELFAQLGRYVGSMRKYVSGPIWLESLNAILAPYLVGRTASELREAGQALCDELARESSGESDRVVVTLSWDLPTSVAGAQAIGPGGQRVGRVAEHVETSRRVMTGILEAAHASTCPLPDLVVAMGPNFFSTPGHLALLELASDVASRLGVPRFRFVRPGETTAVSTESRPGDALRGVSSSVICRESVLASVSIDLPRLGYLAGPDEELVEVKLIHVLNLAARAHIERRVFLEELLARGVSGPLGCLIDRSGGEPILSLEDAVHHISPCGLNELVEVVTGRAMHASPASLAYGRRFLEKMAQHVRKLSRRHKMRFAVGATTDTGPSIRFAKLDLQHHSPLAGHHVKGDLRAGHVLYTPGIALEDVPSVSPLKRLRQEGELHDFATFEAMSEVPLSSLGRQRETAARFLMDAYLNTGCRSLRFTD